MSEAALNLTPSQEDYLEAILVLIRDQNVARVRDIAKRLDVGKSAVTAALKSLSKRELVNYDPYQFITLTEAGQQAAERIDRRHVMLQRFFVQVLGLDDASAEANACRVEHSAGDEVLDRLRLLADFLADGEDDGQSLTQSFQGYIQQELGEDAVREGGLQ